MRRKIAVLMAGAFLLAGGSCWAEDDWTFADRSVEPDLNLTLEIKKASIESIDAATVRTALRFIRTDKQNMKFGGFDSDLDSVEGVMDFDCKKPRYKMLKLIEVSYKGRVNIDNSVPTYEAVPEKSMWTEARKIACKAEGKMK